MYTLSGLYRDDGSAEPLWTVNWYAHGVEVASDGVHLVRHGPFAASTDQEALSFFADGRLLRTYLIRELVDNPLLLKRTASHFFWQKDGRFEDPRLEYTLTTHDGNRFVFDVRTGAIVSVYRPARTAVGVTVAVLGVVVMGVVVLGLLVWRRRAAPAAPRE